MWLRDWIETWGLRVHVMDRTMSLAAINVTGREPKELLAARASDGPAALPRPRPGRRRGVPATSCASRSPGEASFELHHPIDRSVELWRALMDLGGT
jgi:glycine cleavage system aminomethyltransferase T